MGATPHNNEQARICRHPDTAYREVGDDIFLVHPDGETLFNLNPTAAALWRLMAEPMSAPEMAEVLGAAFPDVAPGQIRADVDGVVAELVALGFAVTA